MYGRAKNLIPKSIKGVQQIRQASGVKIMPKKTKAFLDIFLGTTCSSLNSSGMVVILHWQVISRYVLNGPSTFTEEKLFAFRGLVWLSLLGSAYFCWPWFSHGHRRLTCAILSRGSVPQIFLKLLVLSVFY